MNHEESVIQRQCVAWFRAQYPHLGMLLTHVANEGNGNRVTGAIHKAEGTVAGVADLLLFVPSVQNHGLGVEMKSAHGRQNPSQKEWQRMFEAAGYKYVVVRSLEEFQKCVRTYLSQSLELHEQQLRRVAEEVEHDRKMKELARFRKIVKGCGRK